MAARTRPAASRVPHSMLFLWRLLGFRRLLVLFILRRAWRIVQRRRATANTA